MLNWTCAELLKKAAPNLSSNWIKIKIMMKISFSLYCCVLQSYLFASRFLCKSRSKKKDLKDLIRNSNLTDSTQESFAAQHSIHRIECWAAKEHSRQKVNLPPCLTNDYWLLRNVHDRMNRTLISFGTQLSIEKFNLVCWCYRFEQRATPGVWPSCI